MPSQLQQLSLQPDRRPAAAAAAPHQRHHAQLHERRPTNKRENVCTQSGIDTVQLEFQAQLKREKKRSPKSGQRSTSDMHSNFCIPGTRQSYDGHCDDYTFDSGTLLQSGCRNYYDTLAYPKQPCVKYVVSSIHVQSVECGRGQDLAASRLCG